MTRSSGEGNFVNIYVLNTDRLEGAVESILLSIAPYYVRRYEEAKIKEAKMQELGAGWLLSSILGIDSDDRLTRGKYGKPGIKNMPQGCVFSEISISHADNYAVLAAANIPVGVDIESEENLSLPILKRVLPASSYERLKKDASSDGYALAKAWTEVEAVIKADGRGFNIDPRDNDKFMDGYYIKTINIGNGYAVSCAAKVPFKMTHYFNSMTV